MIKMSKHSTRRFEDGYWIECTDDIPTLTRSAEFYLHLYKLCIDRIKEIESKNLK